MSRVIRIEQLLSHNPSTTSGIDRPRPLTPIATKNVTLQRQPIRLPEPALKTSPTSPSSASSSENERLLWELDKEGLASIKHRKRKSPVDEEAFAAANRPTRLPRFSVNVFHSATVNAFPIPNEGVVPRMVQYCKEESPS